jgi:hypothetical protein
MNYLAFTSVTSDDYLRSKSFFVCLTLQLPGGSNTPRWPDRRHSNYICSCLRLSVSINIEPHPGLPYKELKPPGIPEGQDPGGSPPFSGITT